MPEGFREIKLNGLVKTSLFSSFNPYITNIGTQSVQELFFCDRSIRRTVEMISLSFFGCGVQQERNWEFVMYVRCYIGNGKIAK